MPIEPTEISDQAPPFVKKDFSQLVDDLLGTIRTAYGEQDGQTDTHEGSVMRTLVEVFAHEMAVAYEQLEHVYNNAYLDTAQGSALDKVVDLLAIKRYAAGRLEGTATFSRSTPASEAIHIPAGTLLAGKGVTHCATLQAATLEKGQKTVRVPIISQEPSMDSIPAKALNTMPSPITGIETVRNEGALHQRQRAETDEELRQRAHRLIQASRSGTAAALEEIVRTLGLKRIKILEYSAYDTLQAPQHGHDALTPGMIKVIIGDVLEENKAEAMMAEVEARILEVKPAGVMVRCLQAPLIKIQIAASLTLNSRHSRQEKQRIENELKQTLKTYFEHLEIGESVFSDKIKALLLNHPNIVACQALTDNKNTGNISLLDIPADKLPGANLIVPLDQRVILNSENATRLILQNPKEPVILNIQVTLKAKNKEKENEIKKACVQYINELNTKNSEIKLVDVWGKIKEINGINDNLIYLYIMIIHFSNGSTVELQGGKAETETEAKNQISDKIYLEYEKPELGSFNVIVQSS